MANYIAMCKSMNIVYLVTMLTESGHPGPALQIIRV